MTHTSSSLSTPVLCLGESGINTFAWCFCCLASLAAFLAPALWNGFALVFFDSGGYVGRILEMNLGFGRSFFYGAFLFITSLHWWSFFGPIIFQGLFTFWLLHLTLRCHGLPSPQLSGPAHGLLKWFFYPGFNARTGGLLREDGLAEQRQAFDATAWLNAQGITTHPGERRISVFCYADAGLADFIDALPPTPTLWLLAPGAARQQVHEVLAASHRPAAWRCVDLPWLSQPDYDRLLWSCELNVVRGEDSLVRALWAGTAFVWQIYAQRDGAHAIKLRAFLDLYLRDAAPALAVPLRNLWLAFNRLAPGPSAWPDALAWQGHAQAWRNRLWTQADLATQLLRFVEERR